jgi:two-component system nitrogen regulation sensor histidine kinase NtrY
VQRLAEGTQEVALGNLDLHIREGGDDEMGFLISSFNRMIRDLKGTRSNQMSVRNIWKRFFQILQ